MDENNHKKCIAYLNNVEEAESFIRSVNKIKEYHGLEINTSLITADVNHKMRVKILDDFTNDTQIHIICSIRILDECIDIPACDSIFLANQQTNKIRTIQPKISIARRR